MMRQMSVTESCSVSLVAQRWPVYGLLQALLRTRREVQRISAQARRERRQQGFRHVPQRLWDRHSALFLER